MTSLRLERAAAVRRWKLSFAPPPPQVRVSVYTLLYLFYFHHSIADNFFIEKSWKIKINKPFMLFRQSKNLLKTSNSRFHNFDVQAGGWGGGSWKSAPSNREVCQGVQKNFKRTENIQKLSFQNQIFFLHFEYFLSYRIVFSLSSNFFVFNLP